MIDDVIEYEEEFRRQKAEVAFILKEKNGVFPGDEPLDDGIRDLVYAINNLPFVYTFDSCVGCARTREDVIKKYPDTQLSNLRLPKKGYCRYGPGYIGLVFSSTPSSKEALAKVKEIVGRYQNAWIEEWNPIIPKENKELKGLRFEIYFDNLMPEKRRPPIIPTSEGLDRRKVVLALIKDLYDFAQSYGKTR